MKKILLILILIIAACKSEGNKELTADQIINKSIIASGADKVANAKISFKFRDKNYKATRNNGSFKLERSFDSIRDVLSNSGFKRFVNEKLISVSDSMKPKYANSVNSVHYFSVLPFGLNDKAVNKELLSSVKIKDKEYYKVKITFSEDGGGEDFDDTFIYWIGKEDFLIDYLAYEYNTNGGGIRFRELSEQCVKEGVRFVDYVNYKPLDNSISIQNIDKAYEKGSLKKVSEINLRQINIELK